jgi:hypothetical protein
MTQRTPAELYRSLRNAGFGRAAAITMVAVGMGESGGNDTAIGDESLQDSTWGPSVGAWQVRTLKSQTGTGGTRDIVWLNGNLDNEATASYQISSGGVDFTPWTVYKNGSYNNYLSTAQQAAAQVDSATGGVYTSTGATVQEAGLLSGLLGDWGKSLTYAQQAIMAALTKGIFGAAGLTMVIVGATLAVGKHLPDNGPIRTVARRASIL